MEKNFTQRHEGREEHEEEEGVFVRKLFIFYLLFV